MMIEPFWFCAFCQSTSRRVLIVSQEVVHAVCRVRLQETNENNDKIPPQSNHTTTSPVAHWLRRTRDYLQEYRSQGLPQARPPLYMPSLSKWVMHSVRNQCRPTGGSPIFWLLQFVRMDHETPEVQVLFPYIFMSFSPYYLGASSFSPMMGPVFKTYRYYVPKELV